MKIFIKKTSQKAGNYLLANFKKDKKLIQLRATSKEAAIEHDKTADRMIVKEIKKKFPTHGILTEESGFIKGKSEWLWIVDSLDGTGNFANHNPFFSVCIALLHKKELRLGTVFAPALQEFYFAEKGKGAFLNGKRIKVSETKKIKESYVIYCEGNEKNRKKLAKMINNLYPKVKDLRKIGSAGIETAWVAAGKADAYFTTRIDPWDVAAGVLLAKEAGGEVTDFKGNYWEIKQNDLLFSNKRIHEKISQALNNIK